MLDGLEQVGDALVGQVNVWVGGGGGGEQSGIPIKITEKNNCSSLVQVVGMESPLNDELLINNVQG